MLGILLIYFLGKYFYELAVTFEKNKWLFAILGVVSYYAGTFLGGTILALMDAFFNWGMDWDNDLLLSFLALPFGLATCGLVYYLLKRKWQKEAVIVQDEIDDIGKQLTS